MVAADSLIPAMGADAAASVPPRPVQLFAQFNDLVRAITPAAPVTYVGGTFAAGTDSTGAVTRNHVAAVDTMTGRLTGWAPNVNGVVSSIAVTGNTVFLAGQFTSVSPTAPPASPRSTTTGAFLPWHAAPNSWVTAIAISNGVSAGQFTSVSPTARPRIAAVETTGTFLPRHAAPTSWVTAIAISNGASATPR